MRKREQPGRVDQDAVRELQCSRHIRVLTRPRVDYLRAAGGVDPAAWGWVDMKDRDRWWRPGWTGKRQTVAVRGVKRQTFIADADKEGLRHGWPLPWGADMHLTRVDLCCDISGFHFEECHRQLFTGRGTGKNEYKKYEPKSLYFNSRESPIMLRIYLKSEAKNTTHADREEWRKNGWNGKTEVWRVEYELHTKAIPKDLVVPPNGAWSPVMNALWCDCLARIRMCETSPKMYSQNANAPTHPLWGILGTPKRMSRRRTKVVAPREDLAGIVASLERLLVRAGVDMYPVLAARLAKAMRRDKL